MMIMLCERGHKLQCHLWGLVPVVVSDVSSLVQSVSHGDEVTPSAVIHAAGEGGATSWISVWEFSLGLHPNFF